MVSEPLMEKIRKEIAYLKRKAHQFNLESNNIEETITHNRRILDNTFRDLDETGIIIDTMRSMIK